MQDSVNIQFWPADLGELAVHDDQWRAGVVRTRVDALCQVPAKHVRGVDVGGPANVPPVKLVREPRIEHVGARVLVAVLPRENLGHLCEGGRKNAKD